jgi:hypothetical protein
LGWEVDDEERVGKIVVVEVGWRKGERGGFGDRRGRGAF